VALSRIKEHAPGIVIASIGVALFIFALTMAIPVVTRFAPNRLAIVLVAPVFIVIAFTTIGYLYEKQRSLSKRLEQTIAVLKKSEGQIKEIKEYLQLQVDRLPIGLIVWDPELRVRSWNPAATRIFGFSEGEALGKHAYDLIVPKQVHPHTDEIWRRLLGGDETAHSVNENLTRDGRTIICDWTNTPLKRKDGTVIGVLSMVQDITEQRETYEKLVESEERYRSLVEHASAPICTIDLKGRFTYVNEAFAELVGYSSQELLGRPFGDFLSPEDRSKLLSLFSNIMSLERQPRTVEFQIISRDGRVLHLMSKPTRLVIRGKTVGFQAIITDLTEQKRAEAERMKAIEHTAQSIAHDIRNPLQAISLATDMLRDASETERRALLDLINKDIAYADRIIRNLTDFTQLPQPDLRSTNVNILLKETAARIAIPDNVKLNTNFGDIPQILLDMVQLNRAFTNLILNAVQAMPNGGELTISTSKAGDFIEVKVKDTGVGIPRKDMEKLFSPFFTTKAKGTGLGLLTTKAIVEAHGGTITVESEEGKGTTITVRLPIPAPKRG